MSGQRSENRKTADLRILSANIAKEGEKKPSLSKRLMRKIEAGTMGHFCHAANYKGGLDIGRNDRCPCGSGKKFKRCCGR